MRKLLAIPLIGVVFLMMSGCGGDDSGNGGDSTSTSHMITIENEARSASNIIAVYLRSADTDRYNPTEADWGQAYPVNIAPGGWDDIMIYNCDQHYDMQVEFAIKPVNDNEYNNRGWLIYTYDIFLACGEESTYTFQNID